MTARGVAAAALLALAVSACGAGGGSADTAPAADLPPHEVADLAAMFDPLVAPLGYRVTRGALITRATYVVEPTGDHLAIYVAPIDDIGADRFASDLVPLLRVFLPLVFDRWPGIMSFDICQEPFGAVEETPPSQTIVDVRRSAAATVDWSRIELPELIALGATVDGLAVWARPGGVRDSGTWQSAVNG